MTSRGRREILKRQVLGLPPRKPRSRPAAPARIDPFEEAASIRFSDPEISFLGQTIEEFVWGFKITRKYSMSLSEEMMQGGEPSTYTELRSQLLNRQDPHAEWFTPPMSADGGYVVPDEPIRQLRGPSIFGDVFEAIADLHMAEDRLRMRMR